MDTRQYQEIPVGCSTNSFTWGLGLQFYLPLLLELLKVRSSVVSWLDDILISSYTGNEHLATLADVFTGSLKPIIGHSREIFVFSPESRIPRTDVDDADMKPSPSKLNAIANTRESPTVEQLRASLGLTGYLRNFVPRYSIISASLIDPLRNREFASKSARKLPTQQGHPQ